MHSFLLGFTICSLNLSHMYTCAAQFASSHARKIAIYSVHRCAWNFMLYSHFIPYPIQLSSSLQYFYVHAVSESQAYTTPCSPTLHFTTPPGISFISFSASSGNSQWMLCLAVMDCVIVWNMIHHSWNISGWTYMDKSHCELMRGWDEFPVSSILPSAIWQWACNMVAVARHVKVGLDGMWHTQGN